MLNINKMLRQKSVGFDATESEKCQDKAFNESTQAIVNDPFLWREFQQKMKSTNSMTNLSANELLQEFISEREEKLEKIKSKKLPLRRTVSESLVFGRRLSDEQKQESQRSSSLDNTSKAETSRMPLSTIASLKYIFKDSEGTQQESEEQDTNLVEFREKTLRRLSMEKMDSLRITLVPEMLEQTEEVNKGDVRYYRSALTVADFIAEEQSEWDSSSSLGDDESRWEEDTVADDDLLCDFPSKPRKTSVRTFQPGYAHAA